MLDSEGFGMDISCSFGLGFVERSHKPLVVGVMRVKPQLVENKHGIIIIIWFLEELVDLWVNS